MLDPATLTDDEINAVLHEWRRRVTARRPRADRYCYHCERLMPDVDATRKYCNASCKQMAYERRQREMRKGAR